jgi:phage terminase small subunit
VLGTRRKGAHVSSARLLKRPHVRASIAAKQTRQLQQADLTAARVLEELSRIAFFDPVRLYYPAGHERGGKLRAIADMDEDVRVCIASYEVAQANLDKTDGPRDQEWIHRLKTCDKLKALELLAKYFALLKGVVEVTSDWDKLAARLASVRTEGPVDPRKVLESKRP